MKMGAAVDEDDYDYEPDHLREYNPLQNTSNSKTNCLVFVVHQRQLSLRLRSKRQV